MDILDRKILELLQKNGRISNAELARELSVAPSTMLERIRRLESSGVIQSYRAVINPETLGYGVSSFIAVTLERHEDYLIKQFEDDVRSVPNIKSCHHLTGRFDYLLQVAAYDLKHLGELIKTRIASLSRVGKVETFLVLSEVKQDEGWPTELIETSEQ